MKRPHWSITLFVVLVVGLFLTVPAEDFLDTAYDESEALPYESTPPISETMPQASASAAEAVPSAPRRQRATPFLCTTMRIRGTDVHRSPGARVTLALLCTLLC